MLEFLTLAAKTFVAVLFALTATLLGMYIFLTILELIRGE